MSTKTPEQRAQERYQKHGWLTGRPMWFNEDDPKRAEGYATCIREEVEPRDRLLQEAVYAIGNVCNMIGVEWKREPFDPSFPTMLQELNPVLAKAKEQFGITPTP